MLKTYKEVSKETGVNLAKLKRWGREFLPADCMAGQSQGVPRFLTKSQVETLLIAGRMVSELKCQISDIRKIFSEIEKMVPVKTGDIIYLFFNKDTMVSTQKISVGGVNPNTITSARILSF